MVTGGVGLDERCGGERVTMGFILKVGRRYKKEQKEDEKKKEKKGKGKEKREEVAVEYCTCII